MPMWAIAAGRPQFSYTDVFLGYDVMLIGWADRGPFEDNQDAYPQAGQGAKDDGQVRSFATKPRAGDIVLMRLGHEAVCAGVIPEDAPDYEWLPAFGDIDGWDGSHARRVLWDEATSSVLSKVPGAFEVTASQRTFQEVHRPKLLAVEQQLRNAIRARALNPLPEGFEDMSDERVGLALFERGLSNESVTQVVGALEKLRRLNAWFARTPKAADRPTEFEIVTHLLVPLFRGLGWSEQMMAVEWKKVDLAFFGKAPTLPENCVMILEAKRSRDNLEAAFDQARKYVDAKHLVNCRTILTSDGTSLYVYQRDGDTFPENPNAYVNLMHVRERHLTRGASSAIEALMRMAPWGGDP